MATVTYNGSRAYVEYSGAGITLGWTPQRTVENVPEEIAGKMRIDTSGLWTVVDDESVKVKTQTEEMAKVIDPVVEEPVVEEPVVEEPVVEEASDAFDPNWTRNEMVKWFKARGESVPRTSTKATLTARAEALLNPAAEEGSEGDE
jgi:hypothetical protein